MSLLVQAADYLGNYALSSVVYFKFSVTDATGVLTTLGGTPVVKVYKDDGTTETTAGVTLTVDFDSRTGLCQVAIDTSSDGTFYAGGHDFEAVITAGTVGIVSVAGTPVGHFSLLNRVDTLADGVAHGGPLDSSTATLALSNMSVWATSSDAVTLHADAGNIIRADTSVGAGSFLSVSVGGDVFNLIALGRILIAEADTADEVIHITANNGKGVRVESDGVSFAIASQSAMGMIVTGGADSPAVQFGNGTAGTEALKLLAGMGNTDADGVSIVAAGTGHDIHLAGSGDILGNLAGTIDGVTATGLDNILIDGKTLRAALQIIAALVAGKVSGAGTSTEVFKGLDGTTTRASMTVDASGNRTGASYP